MRLSIFLVIVAMVGIGIGFGLTRSVPSSAPAARPQEIPAIGKLGLPFGTVAEVKANLINGKSLNQLYYSEDYLLHVVEVDGHPLAEPVTLPFTMALRAEFPPELEK